MQRKRENSNNIANEIIGYYAGRTADDRFWWRGEEGAELILFISPQEARRYLPALGAPTSFREFYPVEFGEIILGISHAFPYRMSQATMLRFLEIWRQDCPQLPHSDEIDTGQEAFVRFPPLNTKPFPHKLRH